jgi:hypothetical protein
MARARSTHVLPLESRGRHRSPRLRVGECISGLAVVTQFRGIGHAHHFIRRHRRMKDPDTRPAPDVPCPIRASTISLGASRRGSVLDLMAWIGPPSAGDPPMVRRHRLHQSWYRAFVLGLPAGTGPQQDATARYGNMLRAEDVDGGSNFLTDEIHQLAEARIAEGAPSSRSGAATTCSPASPCVSTSSDPLDAAAMRHAGWVSPLPPEFGPGDAVKRPASGPAAGSSGSPPSSTRSRGSG